MKYVIRISALLLMVSIFTTACKKQAADQPALSTQRHHQLEQAFPNIQGEVIGFKVGQDSMYVSKKAGKYVWMGDIALDQESFDALRNSGSNARTFTSVYNRLWPNGIVYYTIQTGFSATQLTTIANAMSSYTTNTPITFVQRTNQANYVTFVPGSSGSWLSSDYIGMKGGQQIINLEQGASWSAGNVIHEIGHTIGLYHEQCRTDRDTWIIVNYNNVVPQTAEAIYQYRTLTERNEDGFQIGTLDINSIMMYGSYGNSDGINFPITLADGTPFSEQRTILSTGDLQTIEYMYGNTRPYGRVELTQTTYSYNNGGDSYSEYEEMDAAIHFYSDAACTIPFTLTQPIKFNVTSSTTTFYSNQAGNYTSTSTITLQPGNSVYGLSHFTSIDLSADFGNYRDGSFTATVYVAPGVGYR